MKVMNDGALGTLLARSRHRRTLGGLSAHADRDALLAWLGHFEQAPEHVFVVHGEAQTAEAFAATIRGTLHWPALAPAEGQPIEY